MLRLVADAESFSPFVKDGIGDLVKGNTVRSLRPRFQPVGLTGRRVGLTGRLPARRDLQPGGRVGAYSPEGGEVLATQTSLYPSGKLDDP